MARETERIVVSEDGLSLPVIEVLTGRGVIFGKSGSGKSNSASVITEELLEKGFPVLIIDVEGEYATLKDRYDIVHIGDDAEFDFKLFETEPEQIVDFCLDQNRPVIIDISDVLEIDQAHSVVKDTLRVLFSREKRVQQPFLVIVEEIHEFLPQQGGLDELGETLIRIAKRGRKRGLGLTGLSQRPASVDKDFITQCDWLVWHRLTWQNDTRVVKSIMGSEKAQEVQELETGEAIMMTDWDETVRRIRFRPKRTADAGQTPSLSPSERRDLTTGTGRRRTPPTAATESMARADSDSSSGVDSSGDSISDPSVTTPNGNSGMPPRKEATTGERDSNATDPDQPLLEPYPSTLEEAQDDGSDGAEEEETEGETESGSATTTTVEPVDTPNAGQASDIQPTSHQEPAVATLWELGQLVTYLLATGVNSLVYGTRLVLAKATGGNEPVDRLGPIPQQRRRPHLDPSRWTVWIFAILVVLVVVLIGFAIVLG